MPTRARGLSVQPPLKYATPLPSRVLVVALVATDAGRAVSAADAEPEALTRLRVRRKGKSRYENTEH